jgi:ParB-like chromosome segregation protein Spo0J
MVGAKGVSAELGNVKKWNPNLGGVLLTWRDPKDGRAYVVNGHHRLDLAKRLGVKDLAVRELAVPDAATARYVGAIANIAEGRGTPVDAAKLLRDSNVTPEQLAEDGVSLRGKLAQDGMALARLPEGLWRQVFRGEMSVGRGVAIGGAGLNETEQHSLNELLQKQESRGKKLSDKEVGELGAFVKSAGQASSTQQTLWGDEEVSQNLAVEKAQLSSWLKGQLAKDKRLFGYVAQGSRAQELARGGNRINVSESQRIAEQSAQMEEVYNRLAHRTGPVSDALGEAAGKLSRGGETNAIRQELYERIRGAIVGALSGAAGGGAQGAEGAAGSGDHQTASLFGRDRPRGMAPAFWQRLRRVLR